MIQNMETEIKTYKYGLYARKSSDSEDKQIQSIDDQIYRLKEFASRNGLKIAEIFKEAKSAKKPHDRIVFEEMIRKIEEDYINAIICWQIDRLSRNPVDSGIIQYMLQTGKIKCIQTINKLWLPDDNAIVFSVEAGQANEYLNHMIRDVKRGFECKRRKGQYPHLAPLGYLNREINREHIIVKDPKRFDLVKKMWDMKLTGKYSSSQILKIANDNWGFRTRKFKNIGCNKLSKNGIYEIFKNPFYCGYYYFENIKYNLSHPKMITEEEYNRVQFLLGKKSKIKFKKHNFAYTGFIRCAECGCLYTAETITKFVKATNQVKEYTYYHCTRKKKDKKCSQKFSVREDVLEKQIEAKLDKITILPEFKEWALKILSSSHDKEVQERKLILETKQKALANTQRYIDNLIDLRCKELIDDKEYFDKKIKLQEDKAKLEEELSFVSFRADKWLEITEKAFNFITNLREVFNRSNFKVKKDILMALGKRITILNGKLNIEFEEWLVPIKEEYKPLEEAYLRLKPEKIDDFMLENEIFEPVRKTWLGRDDSNQKISYHKNI